MHSGCFPFYFFVYQTNQGSFHKIRQIRISSFRDGHSFSKRNVSAFVAA